MTIVSLPPLELKILRLRAGIRQKDLATRLGIHSPQLSDYELGKKTPRPETLARILKAIEEWNRAPDCQGDTQSPGQSPGGTSEP